MRLSSPAPAHTIPEGGVIARRKSPDLGQFLPWRDGRRGVRFGGIKC